MRKLYILLTFFFVAFTAGAQNWQVYDGSVLPSESGTGDMLDVSNYSDDSPGDGMIAEVIADPNMPGNSLFKYFHPDGKRTFRHNMTDTYTDTSFTIVVRVKGNNDPVNYDRVMDIRWDNGVAGTRDELRIYYSGRLKLEKAGVDAYPDIDFNDWHIFRIEVIGDSATVFIDEDPVPVLAGITTSSSDDKRVRFGDGSGDAIGGYLDWIALDTLGASTPATLALPDEWTGVGDDEYVDWHLYTASVLPDQNIPDFSESNTSGDNWINNIIDDPDMPGNKLLELVSSPASTNFMWKHNFPEDNTTIITMVARVKAVSDTVDRPMEFDFRHGGFRERLFINTDGTYELKYAGVKESLPVDYDPLAWHIYRITKTDDQVVFYLDEDPTPINSVVTAETTTDNYFRFGDGNGSYEIGGYVDWVTWTTDGVYGPDAIGLPDVYLKSGDATLSDLVPSEGSLQPAFSPDVTAYNIALPAGSNSITLSATPNYAAASVSGDGELTPLPGTATITVTAENGVTQDYTVDVTVAGLSSDSALASLSPSIGTLDPAFEPDVTSYALEVPEGTTSITFTAEARDPNATVSGDTEFTNIPGTATITVTAEDASTLDYEIAVTVITGTDEDLASRIRVYPNPARDRIVIAGAEDATISIYNSQGKEVKSLTGINVKTELNISELSPGMYILRVSGETEVFIDKLVIE